MNAEGNDIIDFKADNEYNDLGNDSANAAVSIKAFNTHKLAATFDENPSARSLTK